LQQFCATIKVDSAKSSIGWIRKATVKLKIGLSMFILCVLQGAYASCPAMQTTLMEASEHNENELQERELKKFLKLKAWFDGKKFEDIKKFVPYLNKIRTLISFAYETAKDLDPHADFKNEKSLLHIIAFHLIKAKEISRDNISRHFCRTADGRNIVDGCSMNLENIDNLIAAFITGTLETYSEKEIAELDQIWKSIDFTFFPR